jgi:ubiquitin carboxyl-terminal hydrolase 20/33
MGYSGKISQYVQFPTDGLDVRPFLHPDCRDELTEYRLTGVICHIGSVLGGHYTAFVRKGDRWFLADDSHITPVSWDTVMECEAYVLFYQKYGVDDDNTKNELIEAWSDIDIGRLPETQYHIVSRKWLTKFFWCEEGAELDNSDVVCPHGYLVPCDDVNLRATWIPHKVWDMIISRYGGGPDWKHSGDCLSCTAAWKKFQKAQKPTTGRKSSSISITEAVNASFTSSSSSANSTSSKPAHEFNSNRPLYTAFSLN